MMNGPENHSRGNMLAVLIASILIISLITALFITLAHSDSNNPASNVPARIGYSTHPHISINGNSEFNNTLFPSNGVVSGNGTASDPYIIDGWDIDASIGFGIWITNTNAFFIIKNCDIHGGFPSYFPGIALSNCTNGTLIGNNCSNNSFGIEIDSSSDIIVSENIMIDCGMGLDGSSLSQWITHSIDTSNTVNGKPVYYHKNQSGITVAAGAGQIILANCTDITIENQDLRDASVGIEIGFSSRITTMNNNCGSNSGCGIYLESSSNIIVSNDNCSNDGYGIELWSSGNNSVSNNNCSKSYYGMYLWSSSNNSVSGNNCSSNNMEGIELDSSKNNALSNNTCSNDYEAISIWSSSDSNTLINNICTYNGYYGILISKSSDNALSNNTCSNNHWHGILLVSSSSNAISGNRLCNNTQYGVDIGSGSNNKIWNNIFIGNNGAGSVYNASHVQAWDDGLNNWWNTSGAPHGYGNYWSDWVAPDNNAPLGIVDNPYDISGSAVAKDYYPLTTEPVSQTPTNSSTTIIAIIIAVIAIAAVLAALVVILLIRKKP